MFEIRIKEADRELHRQLLPDGEYSLGRSSDNDIHVANPNISRHHLQVTIQAGHIMVTDLGSTNGTQMNGHSLIPNRPVNWSPDQPLQIGQLQVELQQQEEKEEPAPQIPKPVSQQPGGPPREGALTATIVSAQATPQMAALTSRSMLIGHAPGVDIRLMASGVAPHHCRVQLRDGQVELTNLDDIRPALLDGNPLPVGQPVTWEAGHPLQVGSALLHLTWTPYAAETFRHQALVSQRARRAKLLRYLLPVGAIFGLALVCLVSLLIIASQQPECGGFSLSCLGLIFGSEPEDSTVAGAPGVATPTLVPTSTPKPRGPETIQFSDSTPAPEVTPAECDVPDVDSQVGWLDLPFPYSGSAEDFRRISQRSRSGGRINSFFDHEYPIYPPRIASGLEPMAVGDTLLLYNGSLSPDAFSQDSNEGDYYSGHAGVDFAPENPREATTPVLAAADGRLLLAKIDRDDNHMVWLEHDPDGDGVYEYATLYFHLHPDGHFERMLGLEEGTAIAAGERIGTMGTTGRSSGIHLHFEVREDFNGDHTFHRFEKVDPYGYFPSQDHPSDPWASPFDWTDSHGDEYEHKGAPSEYMWIHSLVEEVVDTAGECQETSFVQIDLYPVQGYAVINSGFTYIARDQQGNVVREGFPYRRIFTILPNLLEDVDPDSISLEFLDPVLGVPITIIENKVIDPLEGGGFRFSAVVKKTGRYVLVGREVVDNVPPHTSIALSGDSVSGEINTFRDSVQVSLEGKDDRGQINSQVISVQYSLDCGQIWNQYDGPFTVTLDTPHTCGESGTGEQGVEFDENDFLILAMSEDSKNNIEQPPSQAQFTIR